MKKYILLIFLVNCSSAQIIKTANEDLYKIEQQRTENMVALLNDKSISDSVKQKMLVNELHAKDNTLKASNKIINAYQTETTKAVNETIGAAKDAGFGLAFKWLIGIAGIIFVIVGLYFLKRK